MVVVVGTVAEIDAMLCYLSSRPSRCLRRRTDGYGSAGESECVRARVCLSASSSLRVCFPLRPVCADGWWMVLGAWDWDWDGEIVEADGDGNQLAKRSEGEGETARGEGGREKRKGS